MFDDISMYTSNNPHFTTDIVTRENASQKKNRKNCVEIKTLIQIA